MARQLGGHDLRQFAGAEQVENHEREKTVYRGGQKRGGEDGRSGELAGDQGGQTQVQRGDMPTTRSSEKSGKWTLRAGEAVILQTGAWSPPRGLSRDVSSHLHGRQGSGMGELVL